MSDKSLILESAKADKSETVLLGKSSDTVKVAKALGKTVDLNEKSRHFEKFDKSCHVI